MYCALSCMWAIQKSNDRPYVYRAWHRMKGWCWELLYDEHHPPECECNKASGTGLPCTHIITMFREWDRRRFSLSVYCTALVRQVTSFMSAQIWRVVETGPFEITLQCERYSCTLNAIICLISRNQTNSFCLRRRYFTNQKQHFLTDYSERQ
jgi:hypothetical protein